MVGELGVWARGRYGASQIGLHRVETLPEVRHLPSYRGLERHS